MAVSVKFLLAKSALSARDIEWHEDVVAITSARLPSYHVPRDARFATLVRGTEP